MGNLVSVSPGSLHCGDSNQLWMQWHTSLGSTWGDGRRKEGSAVLEALGFLLYS